MCGVRAAVRDVIRRTGRRRGISSARRATRRRRRFWRAGVRLVDDQWRIETLSYTVEGSAQLDP